MLHSDKSQNNIFKLTKQQFEANLPLIGSEVK